MRSHRVLKAVKVFVFVSLAVAVAGGLVMSLWNGLLPALAGWHTITFPQALALLLLCRLLFGGLRSHGGHWRRHWRERLERMSPEERERFRDGLRSRWHCRGDSPPSTTAS